MEIFINGINSFGMKVGVLKECGCVSFNFAEQSVSLVKLRLRNNVN